MPSDLTPRQKSVLEYVISFQQEHRMAPTVREICAHLGLNGPAGIPLIGTIAAGLPVEAIENLQGELAVSPALFGAKRCFGLRVKGDSMIDAHILDGDLAIIRPQKRVESGEIAAVIVQDLLPEATLKIVRRTRSTLTLEPANPAYSPLVFKGPQRRQVVILGRYVGLLRTV
jgi:repressor LexA